MGVSEFNRLMVDTISIIKKDGTTINDIKANVQRNKIFINDGKLPIEDGDSVARILPSGIVEEYIIKDKGFYTGMGSIPDNYQMSVEKKDSIKPEKNNSYENFNFVANNGAKVFINSNDNSINIKSENEVFQDLLKALDQIDENLLSKESKQDLIKDIKELEKNIDNKEKFGSKFTEFIGKTGSIINIISPYIDLLTKFL